MPFGLTVTLELDDGRELWPTHVHGILSELIEREVDEDAHHAGRKPFSVGLPQRLSPTHWSFRVGAVADWMFPLLATQLEHASEEGVRAGRGSGRVMLDGAEPFSELRVQTWDQILHESASRRNYRFELVSPTAFRSGKLTNPLPMPKLVFGHLRGRWTEFAPPDLMPQIDFEDCGLVVSSFRGRTHLVEARRQKYPGFVGQVTFHAATADERSQRVLDALARLAPYSGIGANTTIGMGQARYLSGGFAT